MRTAMRCPTTNDGRRGQTPRDRKSYKTIDAVVRGRRIRPSLKVLKPTEETFKEQRVMNGLGAGSSVSDDDDGDDDVLLRRFSASRFHGADYL